MQYVLNNKMLSSKVIIYIICMQIDFYILIFAAFEWKKLKDILNFVNIVFFWCNQLVLERRYALQRNLSMHVTSRQEKCHSHQGT